MAMMQSRILVGAVLSRYELLDEGPQCVNPQLVILGGFRDEVDRLRTTPRAVDHTQCEGRVM